MPLPAEGVDAVARWVAALNSEMPTHAAAQLRYRFESYRNAITVLECRAVVPTDPDQGWFEVCVARLRFTRSRGWELYYADRNSDFHLYELVGPADDVTTLLDEIDDDPTGIFFG